MLSYDKIPVVSECEILKVALEKMEKLNLGIVCIVDNQKKLLGIITDGDIRRKLLKSQKPFSAFYVNDAINYAITSPITITPNSLIHDALTIMEKKQIWDIPVVNEEGTLVGLLHLHHALKAILSAEH